MTSLREAAQQALEALEGWDNYGKWVWPESALEQAKRNTTESLTALKAALAEDAMQKFTDVNQELMAALAEPVQEPVAIVGTQEDTWKGYGGQWAPPGPPIKTVHMLRELPEGTLLYAAPRVPLAEWQINDLMADIDPEDRDSWSFRQGVYAAEKHHGVRK